MPEILELPPVGIVTPDDVIRSLRRYVSLMLGSPPWTVRLQRTRATDDQRPVAVVDPGILTTLFARQTGPTTPQGSVQKAQPFAIVCYPTLGDSAADSAERARELATLLDAGFSRGLVTDGVPPVNIGGPFRVPVYAFGGVPIEGPARAGAATAYAHATVDMASFNTRPIQDALDELRYTVVANLRLMWWAGGRVPPFAPIARPGALIPTPNITAGGR